MKAIKVLFLYPNHKGNYMLPPAIGILSACLKKVGYEVDLFDTTQYDSFELEFRPKVDVDKSKGDRLMTKPFKENDYLKSIDGDIYEDWVDKVNTFKPDLIALSATEDLWKSGISLLKHTRDKGILTIAGGVFPTFAPEFIPETTISGVRSHKAFTAIFTQSAGVPSTLYPSNPSCLLHC